MNEKRVKELINEELCPGCLGSLLGFLLAFTVINSIFIIMLLMKLL